MLILTEGDKLDAVNYFLFCSDDKTSSLKLYPLAN